MSTEFFLTDANAASLPQSQVAAMSKTHLMQSVTVLQAGWTSAVKRLNDVTRNRELEETALREEVASCRGTIASLESAVTHAEMKARDQARRLFELETEVAQYRRAERDRPQNPLAGRLQDELIQTKGRLFEVERLLRQRDPLNIQFMKIRLDECTRQREQDKVRLQESALVIARLEQRLRDAEESTAMLQQAAGSTVSTGSPTSASGPEAKRGSRWDFVISNTNKLSGAVGGGAAVGGARHPHGDGAASKPQSVSEVGVQATLTVLKTLDLLEEKNRLIEEAIVAREAAEETIANLKTTIKNLEDSNELLQQSESRKDELLQRLAKSPMSGAASIDTLVRLEDERVNLTDKLRRVEASLWQSEERNKAIEGKLVQMEAELHKVTRSFAAVAEENVQLSHSLQAVGAMSAQELASTLTAGDRLVKLKNELALCQETLEKERVNQADLSRASRENGILQARVEKYQLELAAVVSDNSRLAGEVQRLKASIASAPAPSSGVRHDTTAAGRADDLLSFEGSLAPDD